MFFILFVLKKHIDYKWKRKNIMNALKRFITLVEMDKNKVRESN